VQALERAHHIGIERTEDERRHEVRPPRRRVLGRHLGLRHEEAHDRQQDERRERQQRFAVPAVEVEAQVPVARVRRVEAHRAHEEPGNERREREKHVGAAARRDAAGEGVRQERSERDGAALQDRHRITVVFEVAAGDPRVAVEVALLPHFRPGRIDAERDDRKEEVDDPDAEILARVAGEFEALEPARGRQRGGRRGRRHEWRLLGRGRKVAGIECQIGHGRRNYLDPIAILL
jgi:hypothetical protein